MGGIGNRERLAVASLPDSSPKGGNLNKILGRTRGLSRSFLGVAVAPALLLAALLAGGAWTLLAAPQEFPDAVTADPDHYSVEFENDAVRMVRINYGPGETSVMHHHPASCAVFLKGQPGTFELPTGEVEEMPATTPGQVVCWDAQVHLPTNMGEEANDLVIVEFKGREALQD